ncbi:peptide deformylase [Brytella acorum]|uniref:Peptide deformylase n=1 Tax=Brytella acorum TaxID=2959299 RepID=A0AA35UNE9_9PROT|nr:peptide deformylase [Brytella acorum]MDF3624145.1 peptide deformylase [Brytella acorum]CAI9120651.1 peptide deformylase [Brytella acorum]
MALLKIAHMGHPVLLQPAGPVADVDAPEIRALIADMIETMLDASGAGLAAPQIYRSLRTFVYHVPASRAGDGEEALSPRALINPEISPIGQETMACVEGCLSLPGLRGTVPRHAQVRFGGWNEKGERVDGEAHGFHANVLQHEYDHLDGILYPMRMNDFTTFGYAEEFSRVAAHS